MPETRRHPDDELVARSNEPPYIRLIWSDHLTADEYGGLFDPDEGRELMRREGLDPDKFHPILPRGSF